MMMGECLTIWEFSLIYPSLPKPIKIKNDIFFITKSFIFNKQVFFVLMKFMKLARKKTGVVCEVGVEECLFCMEEYKF